MAESDPEQCSHQAAALEPMLLRPFSSSLTAGIPNRKLAATSLAVGINAPKEQWSSHHEPINLARRRLRIRAHRGPRSLGKDLDFLFRRQSGKFLSRRQHD